MRSCILILLAFAAAAERGREDLPPTVMIALFVRNKAHLLKNTLKLLENQDYPKNRIALFIRTDHNEDDTEEILLEWLSNQAEYHSKDVIVQGKDGPKRLGDQIKGPLEWSTSRFRHLMRLKEEALTKAKHIWADWIWYLDADAFTINPQTLATMVSKSDLTVVAPLLTSVGLYANFWGGMSNDYYYKRTEEYKPILTRKDKGCFAVPMVHSSVFVNLNKNEASKLTFNPENIVNYDGPEDDIISFALSAAFNDIDLHVCNDQIYGYIMLPLDDGQSLSEDLINLSNLKTEMFAFGHRLPMLEEKAKDLDTLGVDQVYLVNLDRRPDRRSNMEAIFNELKIKYVRMQAVDGKKDINESYLQENGISMMEDFTEPYHGRPLTFGEIGCFMSHYNIWQDVIQNGHSEVIVFEDDVRFEPFFKQKVESVRQEIKQLKLDWDLVFLGRKILHNVEEDWVEDSKWLVHVNYTYWTLGYMLTNRGAQKLIEEEPLSKMVPVDEYLPIMYDRHPNVTWKGHYAKRTLKAFSVHPLLLFPTHYTGEEGYISDTENTPIVETAKHDEL